jgi:hypothetical protein
MSSLAPHNSFDVPLPSHKVKIFDEVPQVLLDDTYYIPLSPNFPVDALTHNIALKCCITDVDEVKGIQLFEEVASWHNLPLVFVVPESIFPKYKKQSIVTNEGDQPAFPSIRQFVAGVSRD